MELNNEKIYQVVDSALKFADISNAMALPIEIVDKEMIDISREAGEDGMVIWKPIPAAITENDYLDFEKKLGVSLPRSYKVFLGYKHFIELNFGHQVNFFAHRPTWVTDYFDNIWDSDIDETINSQIIPFASDENGTGYFCFDAREDLLDDEYPIVIYDRTFGIENYPNVRQSYRLLDLFDELNTSLEDWKQRRY